MKLSGKILAFFAVLFFAAYVPQSRAESSGPNTAGKAWAQFRKQHGENWRVKWDPVLGTPSEMRGGRYAGPSGNPEQAARSFLSDNKALFHIGSNLSDLSVENLKHSPLGAHIFFKQTYQGLPVFNGGLDVHLTPANEVFLVHNRYATAAALSSLSLTPSISAADAAKVAVTDASTYKSTDKTGAPIALAGTAVTASSPELGIWRDGSNGYRLAYKMTAGPILYVVDAQSGKILARTQLISFVDGNGQVFDPNPVVTLNNPNLGDENNKNYKTLKGAYSKVTLPEVTQTTKGRKISYTLQG
ncbi:MAG TPA: hypothetical protein VMU16_14730, partial [Candidatus Binataceae bacterium]|nr:hypothetical protein [Candidatus Binataceae bacterium]